MMAGNSQREIMNRIIAGFAIIVSVAIASPLAAQVTTATVTGGKLMGVERDGVVSFKGIPFAVPPVGELRWKSPQLLKAWSGTKTADTFAPGCMQDASMAAFLRVPPNFSEDCLYLNVWTPARSAGEKRAVMVRIYGGAFAAGVTNSPTYEGTNLAKKGVVVVSVSYRVGAFGFLAHPELAKESGKGSGNYGLQDMIAGLHWVKDNISRFGGDPANVTVFGESAGGIAVSMLAASPAAKGLFAKAISESGGSLQPPLTTNEGGQLMPTLAVAEARGKEFFAKVGAANLAAARALGADAVQKAVTPGINAGFWPVADGNVIPGDIYVLYEQGKFNDTPVLIGTNSDEGSLFVLGAVKPAAFEDSIRTGFGAKANVLLAAYPHETDAQALAAQRNAFRDSVFAWPTWAWARLQTRQGKGKAFVYYFDHRTPLSPNGATHAAELGYVFGTLTPPPRGGSLRPEDTKMSDLMMSYWTNFAKTGDPNGAGLPSWPAFGKSEEPVMFFDANPSARPVPNKPQLEAFDEYYAWRRAGSK
jgi:para-nitrobenzyl esterase